MTHPSVFIRSPFRPGKQAGGTTHRLSHHLEGCGWIHENSPPQKALGAVSAGTHWHREELCYSDNRQQHLQKGIYQSIFPRLHVST